jgi:hypothetical protein
MGVDLGLFIGKERELDELRGRGEVKRWAQMHGGENR